MQYTFQDWLPDILGRESGNDPNALFGFRNRGGQFGDTRVSEMTLDEVINFTRPSGPYAQSVKNQIGYVATPTGLGQIVGQTMRGMKDEMGLTGSEMYDEDLQLAMAEQIYNRQGKNAWEALHGMSAPSGMAMPTGISGGGANYNPRAKRRMAKDGSNMMQQKQPQGLLGRLTNRSESTGLNMLESFAAGLDPLIMPSMREGDAIRERGEKRVERGDKNSTIQYLSAQPNGAAYVQMIEAGMPAAQALAKFQSNVEQNKRSAMTGAASKGVQSSNMLPDGSGVMSISRDGSVTVRTAGNEILSGDAAVKFVQDAQANYVANQQDIYGGRRAGTLGADIEFGGPATATTEAAKKQIEMAGVAIEDLAAVNSGIANIDTAISAIDSGAQSGVIEKYLPAMETSTASLRNAMNRMGLDVINSVTFGALSAAEMNLAMETAVPRNLGPVQLKEWLVEKKRVQRLAADALSNAANYLSDPKNTLSGYLQQNSTGGGQGSSAVGSGTQRLRYDPETGEMVPVK